MLEALCGSKNVQRILIFLFVNERCYGTQLHRALKTPLTPVQKALNRLEKGGLITSNYEGKTRIYRFNPAYPLMAELEQLIKKAYTLLPAGKKKDYYAAKEEVSHSFDHPESSASILMAFWKQLNSVKHLVFHAKTRSKGEQVWEGTGKGEVSLTKQGSYILIFSEKGSWQKTQETEVGFTNVFRWTLDLGKGVIALEHLRRGIDHPVFLFHLTPSGKQTLTSVDSHLCGNDTYLGQIQFDKNRLCLSWRVIGPKKNEEIDYYYS